MVDFTLPSDLPDDFVKLIPDQRSAVNALMHQGKILNYALSLEHSKLWAVFSVESRAELDTLINSLPLSLYMGRRVAELSFYNASHPFVPSFSMN